LGGLNLVIVSYSLSFLLRISPTEATTSLHKCHFTMSSIHFEEVESVKLPLNTPMQRFLLTSFVQLLHLCQSESWYLINPNLCIF